MLHGRLTLWKAAASCSVGCAVRTTLTATSSQPCIIALYTVPVPPSPMRIFLPCAERAMLMSSLRALGVSAVCSSALQQPDYATMLLSSSQMRSQLSLQLLRQGCSGAAGAEATVQMLGTS